MKRLLIALMAVQLLAQEPETVFKTGTRLVQVDVVVQSKGKNVEGLNVGDFELYDNDKRQTISVFAIHRIEPPPATPVKPPPGVVANRPVQTGREPVSATVILLDGLNTSAEFMAYARLQALKYLDHANRNEAIAIYQLTTTLKQIQPFTNDRDQLRAILQWWGPTQATVDFWPIRIDILTTAFKVLAQSLKEIPGRKKLIWVTAGIPLTETGEHYFDDRSLKILAPIKDLNDANIAMYPLNPQGITARGPGLMDPLLNSMIQYADRTGGKAIYNTNDLASAIEADITDTDVTYTLGFYPSDANYDGALHRLRVQVKRGGVEVRYRTSYNDEAKPPVITQKALDNTVNAWMEEPTDATAIPIVAFASPVEKYPGYVEVRVAVDPSSLKLEHKNGRFTGSFQLGISADIEKKRKGLRQTVTLNMSDERYQEAVTNGLLVVNQLVANPDTVKDPRKPLPHSMHVVVLDDATGKAGSVRVPITLDPNATPLANGVRVTTKKFKQ